MILEMVHMLLMFTSLEGRDTCVLYVALID